jgi:hypothetical protein
MSLLRTAFWICVVIVVVPIGQSGTDDGARPAGDKGLARQAFGAAQTAVSDLASFCERNPDVCETGAVALARFREKATATAGFVYRAIAGSDAGPASKPDRTVPASAGTRAPSARDTLHPSDLETPWKGPDQGDV